MICKRFILAGIFALAAFSAHAVDFSSAIDGPDGKPIPTCGDKTPECEMPATLGQFAAAALFTTFPDENDPRTGASLSGEEKYKRAALGLRVRDAGRLDLSVEDTALIKRLIAKAYPPIVTLRAWDLLDPSLTAKPAEATAAPR